MNREVKFRYSYNGEMKYYDLADILAGFIEKSVTPEDFKGEYTGLKDKNGKEIYEGDIIEAYRRDDNSKVDPQISEVIFLNGCYMAFNCTYHELYRLWQSELEIIGNIYENPELLK